MAAQYTLLPDGRWFFQHGPMDIVIGAEGEPAALLEAHAAAQARFATLLDELVAELAVLRQPVRVGGDCPLRGGVARRMWNACAPFARAPFPDTFITPMAAVAGAVAQELITSYMRPGVRRAWVNNGGDIALHLAPGASVRVGLYADIARLQACELVDGLDIDGFFDVLADQPVRGLATSGWRGRSFSLGIADSVTVLAASAAQADAAATVIANAVDLADAAQASGAGVVRRPAHEVKDNSDLGAIDVTVHVPPLAPALVQEALLRGLRCAEDLRARGLVFSAALVCQGQIRVMPALQATVADPVGRQQIGSDTGHRCTEVGSVFA